MADSGMPEEPSEDQPQDQPQVSTALVHRSSLDSKVAYARFLTASNLLPTAYRNQPANVLYAVEYGEMLGLPAMAAITGIHIIEGKPTASAALMTALVRREGHKLRVTFRKDTNTAVAELIRKDDPEFTFRAEWTIERAVAAGLCELKDGKVRARDKKGNPLPWEKYTQNMLKWRAVSEVCRDGAEECLMGMHYTPEELGADVDADGIPVQALAERIDIDTATEVHDAEIVEVDWDAEIAKCGSDRDALAALWKSAPKNSAARQKIAAAAEDLKKQSEQGDSPEVILESALNAANSDAAAELLAWLAPRDEAGLDIGDLLASDDAEVLGVDPAAPITLLELVEKVVEYCEKHGAGPRVPQEQAA